MRSANHAEVKVSERQRIPLPVVRKRLLPERPRRSRPAISERLLPERSCRPLPVIDERLSHGPLYWQLTDLGFHSHPLPAGRRLINDVGSIARFLADMGYPIMKKEIDSDVDDGARLEISGGLKFGDG